MRIAAYPFASTGDMEANLRHIERGISLAAEKGARLICFHECALCGYPPIETSMDGLTPDGIAVGLARVSEMAKRNKLYVLLGTVRFEGEKRYNSAVMLDPDGRRIACYDKRALWGWDAENFTRGTQTGVVEIADIKMGIRICFDVRFPELFSDFFLESVPLGIVLFSDTAEAPDPERYDILKGHLRTRAAENVMHVLSVNSLSRCPTAPTMLVNQNGRVLCECEMGKEELLIADFRAPADDFGMQGRIMNRTAFLQRNTRK